MKEINLKGNIYLHDLEGSSEWYYAMNEPYGDLYEAQEIYQMNGSIKESNLYLVHYPDGQVLEPMATKKNSCFGKPVYHDGDIYLLAVDFAASKIEIYRWNKDLSALGSLSLDEIEDCYNLMLHVKPLVLARQKLDLFEIVWPEKKVYQMSMHESFMHRDGDLLVFSEWFEDPDYREEVVFRDYETGQVAKRLKGTVHVMPNGEAWHVY